MVNLAHKLYTEQDYLAMERKAEFKSEYYAGEVFAMAGAKEMHNLIVTNLIREISLFLKKKPCRVYPSDMRVKVSETGLYTYPDITIVCGKSEFLDKQTDTLLNPHIIIEVLSDSTESYDRGKKFQLYRSLPSLEEYILISTSNRKVEKFRRENGYWKLTESQEGKLFLIETIEYNLDLDEIYDKVEF
ncbi:MAG: Uma2 family endonuclease [Leptospiraceae bacterium]|nr:Uma2 family endonuclease [Leptospiraceae bacterium]MCP5495114.1 Uma2 family endonuclease [Leptospiraceae bacterium]